MLHERIVDFAEICFGRRGGIGLRLAGVVHNFRFGNAGQMEPTHRSSAGGDYRPERYFAMGKLDAQLILAA